MYVQSTFLSVSLYSDEGGSHGPLELLGLAGDDEGPLVGVLPRFLGGDLEGDFSHLASCSRPGRE